MQSWDYNDTLNKLESKTDLFYCFPCRQKLQPGILIPVCRLIIQNLVMLQKLIAVYQCQLQVLPFIKGHQNGRPHYTCRQCAISRRVYTEAASLSLAALSPSLSYQQPNITTGKGMHNIFLANYCT